MTKVHHNMIDSKTAKNRRIVINSGKSVIILILIVCCMIPFSSEMVLYFERIGDQETKTFTTVPVKLSDRINSIKEYYDNMGYYDGVTMRTELDVYSPETTQILVYWENNSDEEFTFGEGWFLFKKHGGEFLPVFEISNESYIFNSIGYGLKSGKTTKHIYAIKPFTDKLTPGTYKIKTHFNSGQGETLKSYVLEAEFEVSNNKKLLKKSELYFLEGENYGKYRDISRSIMGTSCHVYKNIKTYDTIITIDGEEYEIAKGNGKLGVTGTGFYETDNKIYLIYSYSRTENGKHCSYICVWDLDEKKDVFKSDAFIYGDFTDIGFAIDAKLDNEMRVITDENGDWIIDNKMRVFTVKREEGENGGISEVFGDYTAYLIYENGGFTLEEYKN